MYENQLVGAKQPDKIDQITFSARLYFNCTAVQEKCDKLRVCQDDPVPGIFSELSLARLCLLLVRRLQSLRSLLLLEITINAFCDEIVLVGNKFVVQVARLKL